MAQGEGRIKSFIYRTLARWEGGAAPAGARGGQLPGRRVGEIKMGWAAGDWVGAPADRRQAFHDHSLRGGHPALLKHGRHPHGGMDLERVGWRGAAIPRRCPARGGRALRQRLVGARLPGKIRGRGWVEGRCHPHGWLDLARVAGRCHRRGGCPARGVVGFAPASLWGRAFSGSSAWRRCPPPPSNGARAGGSRLRSVSEVKLRRRGEIEMRAAGRLGGRAGGPEDGSSRPQASAWPPGLMG